MAKFYAITLSEMREFLKSEKGWRQEVQGREVVFSFPLAKTPFVQIKVYSGILANEQVSRGNGRDSIKVAAVDVKRHIGLIKSKRVFRVEGWKVNLKERVMKVLEQTHARIRQGI